MVREGETPARVVGRADDDSRYRGPFPDAAPWDLRRDGCGMDGGLARGLPWTEGLRADGRELGQQYSYCML